MKKLETCGLMTWQGTTCINKKLRCLAVLNVTLINNRSSGSEHFVLLCLQRVPSRRSVHQRRVYETKTKVDCDSTAFLRTNGSNERQDGIKFGRHLKCDQFIWWRPSIITSVYDYQTRTIICRHKSYFPWTDFSAQWLTRTSFVWLGSLAVSLKQEHGKSNLSRRFGMGCCGSANGALLTKKLTTLWTAQRNRSWKLAGTFHLLTKNRWKIADSAVPSKFDALTAIFLNDASAELLKKIISSKQIFPSYPNPYYLEMFDVVSKY